MKFEGLQKKVSQFMKNLTADTFFSVNRVFGILTENGAGSIGTVFSGSGKNKSPQNKSTGAV